VEFRIDNRILRCTGIVEEMLINKGCYGDCFLAFELRTKFLDICGIAY
jgi:hypothetical protein